MSNKSKSETASIPRRGEGSAEEDEAEGIAAAALVFLAGEPDLFKRFAALTGIDADGLRLAAQEPGFLAGVLEFFVRHEPTLLQFAAQSGIAPERIYSAWKALGGTGDGSGEPGADG